MTCASISSAAPSPTRPITLNGGAGNDTLIGGSGNDVFQGGTGNDFVDGNIGNDVAFLGTGNDTFQWDPGDTSDIVEGQGGQDCSASTAPTPRST